jgi:N utilization substance protein B
MSRRSRARAIVLQILYQDDLNPTQPEDVKIRFVNSRLKNNQQLVQFADQLIVGVRQNRDALDEKLSKIADNWRLSRMAATDRNVLRLGAYELLHTDTPPPVVINEAIELARRYGSDQSAQFVNGVLDRLLKRSKNSDTPPSPPQSSTDDSTDTSQ